MAKMFCIKLNALDLGQVLDGLSARAEQWENTAEHCEGRDPTCEIVIEECRDAEEAVKIAKHYRSIIENIRAQQEAQL